MNATEPSTTAVMDKTLHMQDLVIGCTLAICGNLLISVSLNLQKLTHMRNEKREVSIHYTRNPLWWLGVSMMVIGEVGNFSAYGYAPASLVAPLGTTTVIANMFLAAIFLKEKIESANLFGSALAVIGAVLVVAFAPKQETVLDGEMLNQQLMQTSFIVYICVEFAILGILFFLLYVRKMRRVVLYLLVVAVIASFSVISAKAVSSMVQITFSGRSQLTYITFYIMVLIMVSTAVIQVKYLNQAMKNFESTTVVPTNFVFFTISAIIAGIVFYKEFWGMTALEIFMFLFGCVMSFVGVYFIVAGKGTIEAVKRATDSESEKPQCSIVTKIFPAWLLANMNIGPVQPSGNVNHVIDEDESRRPLAADNSDDSSEEAIYNGIDMPMSKKYGVNE